MFFSYSSIMIIGLSVLEVALSGYIFGRIPYCPVKTQILRRYAAQNDILK